VWKGAGPARNILNPVGLETVPKGGNGSTGALFQSITAVSPPFDSHHKWNWKGAGPPRNMSNVVGQETIPTRWKWVPPRLVPEHNCCFPTVDSHHYMLFSPLIDNASIKYLLHASIDITSGTGKTKSGTRR